MTIKTWSERLEEHTNSGGSISGFNTPKSMQDEIDELRAMFDDIYLFVSMDRSQLTLAAGEMTSQEWRTLKAVLQTIRERMDE